MRILVLAPFDLFPPVHGGSSVVHSFIKHAAERHNVAAVISHLYSQHGTPDLGDDVLIRYCPASPFDRLKVLSFGVNPHYYREADRLCASFRPDVIQCEILWPFRPAWRLRNKYGIPLVWVEHNIEALKAAELGRSPMIAAISRRLERFACRHADHIITLSEIDRQQLLHLYQVQPERCTVITPGPDLSVVTFSDEGRQRIRQTYGMNEDDALLLFVGNLAYEPNAQAVRRIAEDIYPSVHAQYPQARFVIVGQGSENLTQYSDRLTFAGYVSQSDLVAHLSAADVFLAPVESGSGIRVKIPEATACGRAVVATRKAAEGLEVLDEIIRVDRIYPDFVAATLQLMEQPDLREQMGRRAAHRTRQVFGWDTTLDLYEDAYARAAAAMKSEGAR